ISNMAPAPRRRALARPWSDHGVSSDNRRQLLIKIVCASRLHRLQTPAFRSTQQRLDTLVVTPAGLRIERRLTAHKCPTADVLDPVADRLVFVFALLATRR